LSREHYGLFDGLKLNEMLGILANYPRFIASKHHDVWSLVKTELPKLSRTHLLGEAAKLSSKIDVSKFTVAGKPGIRAQLFLEGVAQAQRLPSLQILGTLGLTSAETSSFFDSDSKSWSIGGNLFSPFLNYGQNEARVEAQRARVEQARQSYEAGVLNALREVEDALIEISTFYKEYGWREKQLRAAKNASYLSRARYDAGIVTYVEVLDLDRSYYSAELAASQTNRRYLGSVAKLYRTLGGGWERAAAKCWLNASPDTGSEHRPIL
jgi:multidrug efflux system outer membrane protein